MYPVKNKVTVDKSKTDMELFPSKPYNNYQIAFLKKTIQISLDFPVSIRKCLYRHKIEMINVLDLDKINKILKRMNSACSLYEDFVYVNGSNSLYVNQDMVIIPFIDERMWMAHLTLLGMKTDVNGVASPIFKLEGANIII